MGAGRLVVAWPTGARPGASWGRHAAVARMSSLGEREAVEGGRVGPAPRHPVPWRAAWWDRRICGQTCRCWHDAREWVGQGDSRRIVSSGYEWGARVVQGVQEGGG
jgi:hypothetical protein